MGKVQNVGQPLQVNLVKLSFSNTPIEIFTKISKRCRYAYLLESIEGPEKLAQYSFIGFNPRLVIRVKGGEAVNSFVGLRTKEDLAGALDQAM